MEREILHLVVPAFPIALARVADSRLRGRPVVVAPGNSERALLQCVSKEAATEGLFAGMPLFRARRICPSVSVIPPDLLLLARGTQALTELSSDFTPIIESAAGRVFLDLTGSNKLFGPPRDVAARLEKSITSRLGLDAMAGTGGNKLVSRVAADVLPEPGVYDVFRGSERSFLAPFPVNVIPGVGTERHMQLLRNLNLQQVRDVAELAVAQLRLAVGAFAPLLHERACGVDRSPVQPPRESSEIVEEAFLEQEDNDDAILLAELYRLAEGCGLKLRQLGKETARLDLTVHYADGVSEQGTKRLATAQSIDVLLFHAAEELFHATCRRRVRVRGLRLSCSSTDPQRGQMELFTQPQPALQRKQELQSVLDGLRDKFGRKAVLWGRTMVKQVAEVRGESESETSADLSEYRYCTLTTLGS